MAGNFEFDAELRTQSGTGAARALRRNNRIPVVLYGAGGDSVNLSLDQNEVQKNLEHEAVYSHVLKLNIDGKQESAILKDLQRHPGRPIILHMDFLRVSKSDKIKVHVPVHFLNEDKCEGVKAGGVVTHVLVDVEVSCLPADLPEFIDVDLAGVEIGQSVHLSDIPSIKGVEIVALAHGAEHDLLVASVQSSKSAEIDEATDADVDVGEETPDDEASED